MMMQDADSPVATQEDDAPATTKVVGFSHRVTMDDVVAAYRLFLRRPPEPEGYRHYEGQVAAGMSIERLASIFLDSAEFRRLTQPEVTAVPMVGGYSVCIDAKDTDFAPGILFNHDYEPHIREAISARLRPGQTFVDIGANVGCLSFLAATLVGPTGRVVAFEPNPNNLQRLYAGITLNRFEHVEVKPYAVSDRRTTLVLSGGSNTCVVEARGFDSAATFAQAVVPDDELAYLPAIDFLKMDIEGHEPRALLGCTALILRHNPTLLTEFAPIWLGGASSDGPMAYLRQIFHLYNHATILTHWGDSIEFDDPESVMDHWHRRNAELAAEGTLPDGMLHFDIIATNG
jgi:FkbM family methyltransferase